ncbi:hypothetical protein [Gordonia malaquae]|uniref:hypothetical protein n=1 Tax=Gordonia malaquae TaxID=410332 RepID=UPI003018B0AA
MVPIAKAAASPPIAVICGSMRFYSRMLQVAADLTLAGQIVVMPHCVVAEQDQNGTTKGMLDLLHRRKIDLADYVVVVTDEKGYIGTSTANEIAYATALGKAVEYRAVGDQGPQ